MPEVLPDHVPSPRTPLVWDGTTYRAVRGHTDGTVQVRGEDQLFSIEQVVNLSRVSVVSGAEGWAFSDTVPAGRYWIITNVMAQDNTTLTTLHLMAANHNAAISDFHVQIQAFGAWEPSEWNGHLYLDAADNIRVIFAGSLVGDSCQIQIHGYQMTLET